MLINFCGVRGSTPATGREFSRYGGHTSCVALTATGCATPTLLLDAGIGLQNVPALLSGGPFDGSILLSHLHWDHVVGLPFFPSSDRGDARTDVLLPDQPGGGDAVDALAGLMRPPYFPIGPTELQGRWRFQSITPGQRIVEEFTVLTREVPHKGGRTFGYRVSDGDSVLTYIPDHCPTALGPGEDGLGEYHEAALELARGADMLVHDAQVLPSEIADGTAFGHSAADYALGLARRAGARSVALFHHRHDRTDEELDALQLRLQDLAHDAPRLSVAVEGQAVDLCAPLSSAVAG